jgi:hypothetical protein
MNVPFSVCFIPIKGHIMVPLDHQMALIDTGSPISISSAPFRFCGVEHTPPTELMGITTETLSTLSGIKIDILIGCDLLSTRTLRIRWQKQALDFGDDIPDGTVTDKMDTLQGCPVFPLRIGDTQTKAIFDTGAHLSYISPELVAGKTPSGEKADFHPFNGHFTTKTWMIETNVAHQTINMEYGILPPELQKEVSIAMHLSNSSAIIGTELLQKFDCTLSWKKGTISWSEKTQTQPCP